MKDISCTATEGHDILGEETGRLYRNDELEGYFREIVIALQRALHYSGRTHCFRVSIIKDPSLNAFSLPNGTIYIHTGLLARLENEAQLASLLAHEMSHGILQHPLEVSWIYERSQHLRGTERHAPPDADLDNSLQRNPLGVRVPPLPDYERLEREADLLGMRLVMRLGYDPREMGKLLHYLKGELEGHSMQAGFRDSLQDSLLRRLENCERFLLNVNEGNVSGKKGDIVFLGKMSALLVVNAQLNLKSGRYLQAIRDMEKYFKVRRRDPEANFLMGEIFRKRAGPRDLSRARNHYLKAISIDPNYPAPYRALGIISYKEKEWASARKWFRLFLKSSSNASEKAYARHYLEKCQELEEMS